MTENKSISLKADYKDVDFPTQYCLGSTFNEFGAIDSREASLKGNVYDSSVDNSAINKSDILNICKYLMVQNGYVLMDL